MSKSTVVGTISWKVIGPGQRDWETLNRLVEGLPDRVGFSDDLAVVADMRGRGVGSLLRRVAREQMLGCGVKVLAGAGWSDGHGFSVADYLRERDGYRRVGVVDRYWWEESQDEVCGWWCPRCDGGCECDAEFCVWEEGVAL